MLPCTWIDSNIFRTLARVTVAQTNLRKFRHDIATLKKRGLISGVDARSIKPTKKLLARIDRFDDVLSGKATPVKLSISETKNLKAAGYDVFKGRVLFPHSIGEKVGVSHGHAKTRDSKGTEHITIPVPFHDLEAYVHNQKGKRAVESMKGRDEYFGFRYYGFKSRSLFHDIDSLINYLQEPTSGAEVGILNDPSKNAKQMNETYRNLEIIKVHRVRDWTAAGNPPRKSKSRKQSKESKAKSKAKKARAPKWKKDAEKAAHAEEMRTWRAGLSDSQREKYRQKARIRAKKSQNKEKRARKSTKKVSKKNATSGKKVSRSRSRN